MKLTYSLYSLEILGVVMDMLTAEKATQDYSESDDLKVYLRSLGGHFAGIRGAEVSNPPPSLSSSFGVGEQTAFSYSVGIPPTSNSITIPGQNSQASTTSSGAVHANNTSPSLNGNGSLQKTPLSPHHQHNHHQRFPSKSDAVRKLIEENRLAPHILPSSLSSSISIESDLPTNPLLTVSSPLSPIQPSPLLEPSDTPQTSHLFGHPNDLTPPPLFGPTPSYSNHTQSNQGPLYNLISDPSQPPTSQSLQTANLRPASASSASSLSHLPPPTPPSSLSSSSSDSTTSSIPSITHGYSRRGHTNELSFSVPPASSTTEDSSNALPRGDSKAAGIRLKKAYDNVTVSEVLSDPKIQLTPTTHKEITLEWNTPPKTVLIIKKRQEPGITDLLKMMAVWLQEEKNIKVLVEPGVSTELPGFTEFSVDDASRYPDFVICLGGDGTVLHANTLFQNSMPPLMAFNLGSLGFLTPFRVKRYKQSISGVLSQCRITLRSRLFCVVVKNVDGKEQVTKRTVLNEVVIDRGYSPYLSNLECFCDNVPITTIQADGIIVSSTTGSTAYSLSAGGSMVHPQVPAILFTPICPHSLSFRPLIFPDSVELKIQIPFDSRSTAWASFDGREQTELHRGDHLIIRVSKWPFVCIRDSDSVSDWFKSLADCLHWNDRRKQKSFNLSAALQQMPSATGVPPYGSPSKSPTGGAASSSM